MMRWKREKAETELAAVCAPPRGYEYHDAPEEAKTQAAKYVQHHIANARAVPRRGSDVGTSPLLAVSGGGQ